MKKELLSFTVKSPKHRAHHILFCENTPFKPKIVKPKTDFQRKPKHQKREDY